MNSECGGDSISDLVADPAQNTSDSADLISKIQEAFKDEIGATDASHHNIASPKSQCRSPRHRKAPVAPSSAVFQNKVVHMIKSTRIAIVASILFVLFNLRPIDSLFEHIGVGNKIHIFIIKSVLFMLLMLIVNVWN